MNMKKPALLALCLVMALSLAACGTAQPNGAAAADSPFAEMDTVDLDGSQVTSDAFVGSKLTLVNLWNIGCTACVEEMPALQKLADEYADKGLNVMGLYYNFGSPISNEDRTAIDEILANAGSTFPHLVPSEAMMQTRQLKTVSVFPTTFLVDSKGSIVGTEMGSNDFEGWSATVDKYLEKLDG